MGKFDKAKYNQLREACWLTASISKDKLPADYKTKSNYKNARFVGDVFCYAGGTSYSDAAIIGVTDNNMIIIAFRGTDGAIDALVNDIALEHVQWENYGHVHEGFLNSYNNVNPKLRNELKRLKSMNQFDEYEVYVTGHSKGGAMATLMGRSLFDDPEYKNRLCVVTIASPRVAAEDFAGKYPTDLPHYRIESFLDFIPHTAFTKQEYEFTKNRIDKVTGFLIDVIHIFISLDSLYVPVGKRYVFKCNKYAGNNYLNYPVETGNSVETLNSYYAAFRFCMNHPSTSLGDIHNFDYEAGNLPDDLFIDEEDK